MSDITKSIVGDLNDGELVEYVTAMKLERSEGPIDEEQYTGYAEYLKRVKLTAGECKIRRDVKLRPLNQKVKQIRAFWQPALDILEQTEKVLKQAIADYKEGQKAVISDAKVEILKHYNERIDQAEREAMALNEAGRSEEASIMQERIDRLYAKRNEAIARADEGLKVEGDPVHTRRILKWRLVDFSKVPDDYKSLDEVKVRKAGIATDGAIEIPGIEFYHEEIVAAGGAK